MPYHHDIVPQPSDSRRTNRRSAGVLLLLGFLAWAVPGSVTATEGNPNVTVEVVNALTGAPRAGLRVDAKRRVGDEFEWVARRDTDAAGQAAFDLTGVDEGVPYAFFAQPYNTGTVQSPDVTHSGLIRFPVGQIPVRVVAGGTAAPLAATNVTLKEKHADGALEWLAQGTTDAGGTIVFDPPGLGSGRVFILEAKSPWDGSTRRSHEIRDLGGITFVVGNAPLYVTLVDAISLAPLPGQSITAYEVRPDSSLAWAKSATTDAAGRSVFDLQGLGNDRTYVLKVRPFAGSSTYSEHLSAAGEYLFKVGTLAVTVVNGTSEAPIPQAKVYAYERLADGKLQYKQSARTNDNGVVRFDLPGLGPEHPHVLKTTSPWDGSRKYSNEITAPGEFLFVLGRAPLFVTLVNGLTGEALPGVAVSARERFTDGSSRSVVARTTDADGRAVFDLEGLGDGRVYFLAARAYDGGTAYSDDLTSAGEFEFRVGMLEVTVVGGDGGEPLRDLDITARERVEGGSLRWVTRRRTDNHGIVRFDLPGLGNGRTYVLEAQSPLDGTTKRSDDLTDTGRYRFVVGNAPLRVHLVNGLSGDPVPDNSVTAYRKRDDGRLDWVTRRTTDQDGRVAFDLADLGEGATYVLEATPYNGGQVYSDELREPGSYEFRVGTVRLKVVSGADGEPLRGLTVDANVKTEGKLKWAKRGVTDDAGVILFDLPGLGQGAVYVVGAKSPSDGSYKYSQEITEIGNHFFRVGNAPLIVTLINGLHENALPGMRIHAYERTDEEHLRWAAERTTDAAGQAIFDLDGLGEGRVYVLKCLPYNGDWVYSDDQHKPGPFLFRVGTLEATLTSGADGSRLANTRVTALEVLEEGKSWVKQGNTDADGLIRFDLPGLGKGRRYVLEAASPSDGSKKLSREIDDEGFVDFVVGGKPLFVTLVNGLSGAALAGKKITVRELLMDRNESLWVRSPYTNDAGKVVFDLEGLGDGRIYALEVNPYNGGTVRGGPIAEPGAVLLRVGTVPVTLIDDDNDLPLAGKKIVAYEKLPDGRLRWAKQAYTDDTGSIHFDLEGVSETIRRVPGTEVALSVVEDDPGPRVYVFRAYYPFDDDGKYYSRLVGSEGAVEFRVSRDGEYPLDLTPPDIAITSPADGSTVNANGFTVSGLAGDNVRVTGVVVNVTDTNLGDTRIDATFDSNTRRWTADVTTNMVTSGLAVVLRARAFDQAQNQSSASVTVVPMADAAPPQITITSHQNGASVEKTGFLFSGTATDDIGVASLTATLDDPVLGRTIDQQPISVATGGSWTLVVQNGQITENAQINVTLVALDALGNQATAAIQLQVVPVDFEVANLINRITFGATPELLAQVEATGADAFLAEQLTPAAVDDSAFAAIIGPLTPATKADMQRYVLLHAIYSRRQLLEVMTQFWDNHFNTDMNKHNIVAYELAENDLFRQNALGRFRDLLEVSAKSPAMLIYLDQATSMLANPNENYPREVLELHAMGVNGGYTQTDVEQVARAFTGWTVVGGQFFFDPAQHDTGQKVFLGQTLAAGRGVEDGEEVLDIIAAHPSTASFICTKLAELLVSDTPTTALVGRCATTFLSTGGEIGDVLLTLLRSPELGDAQNFRAKVKTPLEFAVGLARNLSATSNASDLASSMSSMGMNLQQNPVPTGWSEIGTDWINSNLLLQRVRFANRISRGSSSATTIAPRNFFLQNGQSTAEGVTGFLFRLLFHHDFTQLEYDVALDTLTEGGTQLFDINAPDADQKLRAMLATVLSFPGYQYQ